MLLLTRRVGEAVVIGTEGEITVRVIEVRGNHVRLGIEAPKNVAINREEIWERILAELRGTRAKA